MTAPLPSTRILLSDLTPAQIALATNGCGSHSGPFAWLRPPQGHARDVCDQHDLDYFVGGRWHSPARWTADWRLLVGMLRQARERRWWQRPGFVAKAVLYWVGVRLGGAWSFHHGAPRTIEDLNRKYPPSGLRVVA